MDKIILTLPGNEKAAQRISEAQHILPGKVEFHRFPDGESYIRLLSDVNGKEVVIVATLNNPDPKLMFLYFLIKKVRDEGAAGVTLLAPYLPYLRQDAEFRNGEALTSSYFAAWLSALADRLVTFDPHLHRIGSLQEVYTIPATALSTAPKIAEWIKTNVTRPLVIGPDAESGQWVSEVAAMAGARHVVFHKTRTGDREVVVRGPEGFSFGRFTPVIVDDVISTGQTMTAILKYLKRAGAMPAICIGIHAIFSPGARTALKAAGAQQVVTTDTIPHVTNRIFVTSLMKP